MAPTAVVATDLRTQYKQIEAEYTEAMSRHRQLMQTMTRDSVGDDTVDVGTKAAASGQDEAELRYIIDRRTQLERAIERLDAGRYGTCESCGDPIPSERLELFPSATTCVKCKQLAERRR
jgi:DnaK suppressor protein